TCLLLGLSTFLSRTTVGRLTPDTSTTASLWDETVRACPESCENTSAGVNRRTLTTSVEIDRHVKRAFQMPILMIFSNTFDRPGELHKCWIREGLQPLESNKPFVVYRKACEAV